MSHDITLAPITLEAHGEDALDLAARASDYATLEIGHAPDMDYIRDFFTAVPPGLGRDCLLTWAIMDRMAMAGMICVARGYVYPDDWWIGLMLMDPAFRSRGIGHSVVEKVKDRARAGGASHLKLAVLRANPRALAFWRREGFVHHRDAPARPGSDGHDREVLKYKL